MTDRITAEVHSLGSTLPMPELKGISHIELTVTDYERAALWWQDVMGFVLVHQFHGERFEGRNLIHSAGIAVAVMTHEGTAETGAFDETRVGLDHLAFEVANREELERWVSHLEAHGVSNSGVIDAEMGPTVVFRDPDNMQLEFFVHPSADQLAGKLTNDDSEDARRLLDEAEQRRIRSQAEEAEAGVRLADHTWTACPTPTSAIWVHL